MLEQDNIDQMYGLVLTYEDILYFVFKGFYKF